MIMLLTIITIIIMIIMLLLLTTIIPLPPPRVVLQPLGQTSMSHRGGPAMAVDFP
jgi:hypothetical protein